VIADPDRVAQIVRNLLSNALKLTPPGGQVTVASRSAADGAQLSVSDTGIGVAPGERDHIFDRFWRSPDAVGVGGTGVGLAARHRAPWGRRHRQPPGRRDDVHRALAPGGAPFAIDSSLTVSVSGAGRRRLCSERLGLASGVDAIAQLLVGRRSR
jgi:hypothetical protein